MKLIKRYSLDKVFDEMYFNFDNLQPHVFKNKLLKKLDLDIYIDDDLSLIKYVAPYNPKTKFFWLNQNQINKPLSDNIFAISKIEMIFS